MKDVENLGSSIVLEYSACAGFAIQLWKISSCFFLKPRCNSQLIKETNDGSQAAQYWLILNDLNVIHKD